MAGFDPRLSAAIVAGRAVAAAVRASRLGGGTSLPGSVAQRLAPTILSDVTSALPEGVVLVSGTNGKTTTSRLLSNMFSSAHLRVLHNRSGSNLVRGIVSSVVVSTHASGRPAADVALFETDEAALPLVLREVEPRVIVLNNLFRDQLDRYGELDTLYRAWERALAALGARTTLAVNADDPALARLAAGSGHDVLYFGLDAPEQASRELPHAADAAACASCRSPLEYSAVYVSHMGEYSCPGCGFSRPELDLAASDIRLEGTAATEFTVRGSYGEFRARLNVPGLYNVYNALAAIAGARTLGLAREAVEQGLRSFSAAFGRFERVRAEGRDLVLALVKNPVGCNEVIRMFASQPVPEPLLIVINDRIADGRDVSWLWDADFEMLASLPGPFVTSGLRAHDMALRLKYAGVAVEQIRAVERIPQALHRAVELTSPGGTLRIMPTYTAMLELREHMAGLGWVEPYWEE